MVQLHALASKLIQVRRLDDRGAKTTKVTISHVVGEKKDDIGFRCVICGGTTTVEHNNRVAIKLQAKQVIDRLMRFIVR